MGVEKLLWEVLVPRHSNQGTEYSIEHHRAWDETVRTTAGGLTVLRTARGQWLNPNGEIFRDEMIPVRVWCSEDAIRDIMNYTKKHYQQEAVLAYVVSQKVLLLSHDGSFTER